MLDWNDLKHFLAVHREGNLARAGTALGINATTVGRRITALEEAVGARLFDRTPDGWTVTVAGADLLPRAMRMEQEALAAERQLIGADDRPAGRVVLSATEMLSTRFLAPHLHRFHARYPDIELDLMCTNAVVSLARREADIALRLARPREENLIIKRLSRIELALYASRAYIERVGAPADPETSLGGHGVVLFRESRHFQTENAWVEDRLDGGRVVLRSDSVSSVYSAVLGGLGIGLLPRVVADAEPELVHLATRSAPDPREVWQSVHRDLAGAARIRAVLQFVGRVLTPREDGGPARSGPTSPA